MWSVFFCQPVLMSISHYVPYNIIFTLALKVSKIWKWRSSKVWRYQLGPFRQGTLFSKSIKRRRENMMNQISLILLIISKMGFSLRPWFITRCFLYLVIGDYCLDKNIKYHKSVVDVKVPWRNGPNWLNAIYTWRRSTSVSSDNSYK
jgi:hypothetical protein